MDSSHEITLERFYPEYSDRYPRGFEVRHWARYAWVLRNLSWDMRVLDVGCGCGYGAHLLNAGCRQVVGLDSDDKAIRYAVRYYGMGGLSFVCGEFAQVRFTEPFDAVVAIESCEHMGSLKDFAHAVKDNLAEGGTLLLTTPEVTASGDVRNAHHVHEYTMSDLLEVFMPEFASVEQEPEPESLGVEPWNGQRFLMLICKGLKK